MNSLYKQHIIDHYRNPRNAGRIEHYTHSAKVLNASCGDEIEVFLVVKDDVITEIQYECRGCAISTAAISMLSERVKGVKVDQIDKIPEAEVLGLVGMDTSSGRMKCAILSLEALHKALG